MLVTVTQSCIAENACIPQNQNDYQKRYDDLVAKYETAKAKFEEVSAAIAVKEAKKRQMMNFVKVLKEQDSLLTEFDSKLWSFIVDFMTVGRDKEITVTFKDGTEIRV